MALLLDANPSLTTENVRKILQDTAQDWGPAGQDVDYGFGRLDAYAAVRKAGNFSVNNPIAVPAHTFVRSSLSGTGQSNEHTVAVNDANVPLAVTLIMPGWQSATNPDFDLYVYDPSGVEVGRSTSATRQETVGKSVVRTGNYTVKVVSYTGSGDYFVDISGGLGSGSRNPEVHFVAPAEGASVSGMVRVKVTAAAEVVSKVELQVASGAWNNITANKDPDGSYYYDWDTTRNADGAVALGARVTDGGGRSATASRNVTVANHRHSRKEWSGRVTSADDYLISYSVDAPGYVDLELKWTGGSDLDFSVYSPWGECVAHPGNSGSPESTRVNTERFGTGTYEINVTLVDGNDADFTVVADAYARTEFVGQAGPQQSALHEVMVPVVGRGRVWLNWEGTADLTLRLFNPEGGLLLARRTGDGPILAAFSFDQSGVWQVAIEVNQGEARYQLRVYAPAEVLA